MGVCARFDSLNPFTCMWFLMLNSVIRQRRSTAGENAASDRTSHHTRRIHVQSCSWMRTHTALVRSDQASSCSGLRWGPYIQPFLQHLVFPRTRSGRSSFRKQVCRSVPCQDHRYIVGNLMTMPSWPASASCAAPLLSPALPCLSPTATMQQFCKKHYIPTRW